MNRSRPAPLRAILLDHDGTLVDSEPIHFRLWNTVLKKYRISLSERHYQAHHAGMPARANAEDIVARFGLPVDPAALTAEKNAATLGFLARNAFPLMPGVRDALVQFSALGLKLAVVTAANANGVRATLRAHALEPFFSLAVSSDDIANSKPAPDCYLFALDRLGLNAAECMAIEDTEHGVQAAAQAGIECIAVPTEMSRHHDFSGAALRVNDMAAAVACVRDTFLRRKNET
ncbi:MAG: HAD family phosphatase [Candidatus Accumulibacter sp.]|jgi:HAD superfamily hydrolase (TIGR01509 family)|nr:HAD family phosphatase [Accumulibacter sp.]